MSAPPTIRIVDAVDEFCERLIADCRGPTAARHYRRGDADEGRHRSAASGIARQLLTGHKDVLGPDNVGQPAERYLKETLIWPVLDALGHEYRVESYLGTTDKRADFRLVSVPADVIGECKAPNNHGLAVSDFRNDTIVPGVDARYGLTTDGFNWQLHCVTHGSPDALAACDIRRLVANRLEMKGLRNLDHALHRLNRHATVDSESARERDTNAVARALCDRFSADAVTATVRNHAFESE